VRYARGHLKRDQALGHDLQPVSALPLREEQRALDDYRVGTDDSYPGQVVTG
jgi:hypothetical protein